jgi:GntR family transcriptional regulator
MEKQKVSFASSRIPLYYQLENVLREKITSGVYADGERIPTEIELIKQYKVSRITVRQALAALADDGLIERKQGRGTFVSERKSKKRRFTETIHLTGSLDELIEMGIDTPVKVLEMNRVEADTHEAELLKIKTGTPIYRLKRLRMVENKPYSLILNYLPEEIGSGLTMAELSTGAVLHTMETKLGLKLAYAVQEIKAELADPYVADLLDIRVGSALLSIERTVYSDKEIPVEYVHTLYRSDLYGYSIKLVRDEKINKI